MEPDYYNDGRSNTLTIILGLAFFAVLCAIAIVCAIALSRILPGLGDQPVQPPVAPVPTTPTMAASKRIRRCCSLTRPRTRPPARSRLRRARIQSLRKRLPLITVLLSSSSGVLTLRRSIVDGTHPSVYREDYRSGPRGLLGGTTPLPSVAQDWEGSKDVR